MEQVKQDIKETLDLIEMKAKNPYDFKKHAGVFLFSTENQEGINKVMPYEGKKMLMPASSGDQYIAGVYYGAKKIDLYDINRLTYYITYLKVVAICNLSYREFIDFFFPLGKDLQTKKSFWNLRTLKRLLPILPADVAYFWDNIMYKAHLNNFGDFIVIDEDKHSLEIIQKGMPFYSSEEEYYKLQAMLKKMALPTFKESDITKLGAVITSKYDVAYLSNIIECLVCKRLNSYYGQLNENYIEMDVVEEVLSTIMPLVEENGTILMDYRANRDLRSSTDWLFYNEFFEAEAIPSKFPPNPDNYRKSGDTDLVLTYRPASTGNILASK